MDAPRFHAMPDGRRIAFRQLAGAGPTLVFLPGYMSDMAGSKASALFEHARETGRACLLLDYSGCGESPGDFAQGTLARWRDEVLALIAAQAAGPVVLIGSSMGGWLMLLVALELEPDRLAGLIGIAAAPDFTEWGFDAMQKAALARGEIVLEENPYGPEPTPTHPGFWRDGQGQLLLDGSIAIDCPVRLLHGLRDCDVPCDIALRLSRHVRSEDVQVVLVKDGDHRLSRSGDVALLLDLIESMPERP